jgi:hypothetical protein
VPGITRVDGDALSSAWVLGLETPYYAITDEHGRYRIDELAAGSYEVTIWQPPVAIAAAGGGLVYGPPIVVHRTIHVDAAHTARLDVVLGP